VSFLPAAVKGKDYPALKNGTKKIPSYERIIRGAKCGEVREVE